MHISVIIPTYNRADLVREALESVFLQTYKQMQVIVVDDGSTDHTDKVLSDFGDHVQTIRLGRSGISMARNAGIDAATGEYLAFLDNDDLWEPTKLEKQLQFATAHPEMAVTYTDAIEFNNNGPFKRSFVENFPALNNPADLFIPMVTQYAIPLMSATMIQAKALKERGLRFQNYLGIDDLGLFLAIMLNGEKFGYLPERLTMRRMHGDNFSGNHHRRFEQRKFLYSDLLRQPHTHYTADQKSALTAGLRDARYRVGECLWEELDLPKARNEFFHAIAPDARGVRAIAYGLLTLLPAKFIAEMRNLKASR